MSEVKIVGKKIKAVRPMTDKERATEGWAKGTSVIELDDGTILYASTDEEGNGPGEIFGWTNDYHFMLT